MLYLGIMKRLWLGMLTALAVTLATAPVYAAQSSSPNYEVNEVQFGPGGLLKGSSPNYQAQESLGSNVVGNATSPNYGVAGGFLTPNEPYLQMSTGGTNLDLGTLSSASASYGTTTFSVRTYIDSGYVVMSMSNPPTQEEGAALKALTSPTASSPGSEQFGINLVQNLTSCTNPAPANFGANPVPVPNSSFATGQAASGYNTCGLYKYHAGDVIAQSSGKGWGETDFTISYLININSLSKAGHYSMVQDLVAVPTY